VAAEDNGRTGTTEPGAAATFMSFAYISLKVWLCTLQDIACQKKQGQLPMMPPPPAAVVRRGAFRLRWEASPLEVVKWKPNGASFVTV
jgi:hypothetical protein